MTSDQYGQLIYNDDDIVNLLMSGKNLTELDQLIVDQSVNLTNILSVTHLVPNFVQYTAPNETVEAFDFRLQKSWHMPEEYYQLDIVNYVLSLCSTQDQLQRCGEELLLYQTKDLFNLLRYLKYLVDTMNENNIIWGVGRGSSVASYVLFLLRVHKVDSMYYNLDINEFLR